MVVGSRGAARFADGFPPGCVRCSALAPEPYEPYVSKQVRVRLGGWQGVGVLALGAPQGAGPCSGLES